MSSDEPLQTILVVDDEPTNIQALGSILKGNYRVQVANSGDRALAMLQAPNRPKPDLILLDIEMPGLDGYEICRRLKADPQTSTIDIIFITARDAASDEEYGLSLGAVDYITKPFSPAIVRARVDTHMRLRHKTDLLEQQVAEIDAQCYALDQALQRAERSERIGAIGHWLAYPETGKLIWSPMTYALCGFDPEGPLPDWEAFIARVPEADRNQVAEIQFEANPTLRSCEGEYRIVHPGGRTLWVREIAQRWQDEHGQSIIQGTIQDITEQREALERSEARRQQIEAILRAIPDVALTETDLEGTVREASCSAERMFGYTRAQLIGSNIYTLHDPSDHAQVREKIARLQQTGEGYTTECELIRGTGERFQAQLSVAPLRNERGEVVGEIAACIDLSNQFAHEQRLRMAQEAAGFGVWDWDLAADQVCWDEACWRMLGYDPDQQRTLTFADWQAMVHPEDLERVQPVVESHLAEGRPFTIELRYRCADGGWLWVQGRGQTLRRAADGSPSYMVGTHVDISDQKRAAQELAEAVAAKTTFLNAVSHDLRSPLNALTGFVELLAAPDLGEEERQSYVRQCRHASARLLELIDSLLDLSRLQAGRLELRPAPFDLHAAIQSQCTVYRHLAGEHGLAFTCTCGLEAGVPQWVEADATRLGQILSNLLSNAIKYTQEGGIDLRVCTELDDRITFQVRDTGPGIPSDQQGHIFAAFDRAGYQGSRSGHGLGLAIVRELTELFGGEIALESTPGVGSTFTVTLPLTPIAAPERERDAAPDMETSPLPRGEEAPASPLHVLVADDEPTNVFLAQVLLEQLGCTVTTAKNGTAALEAWQTQRPDALLLDRHMPDFDGEVLAERIRAEEQAEGRPRVPIALYTAYARSEVETVLEGGLFDTFLGKPLDRTELRQWIKSLESLARRQPPDATNPGEPHGSALHS
ncbi:hypothetical protein CKO15_09610 [Halorhodospira abdelmalekii]|uniref:response regulator n=1 Tax=Halorhodospira abdelmalekii TaxID=421629 RepID=UPI0019051827|nr:response regulator [Halorhodospira abdelmalekii]MBK1735534.1 hypothetical protein [Halorhodospira abdelmalekii]